MVLTSVTLPIFFVISLGFLLRRFGRLDEKVFSRAQLYVLSPALVFMAMARIEEGNVLLLKILLYVAVMSFVMLGISQAIGFTIRGSRCERYAISLTSGFMNAGFYGLPVCLLAFGEQGLIYGTIFVVTSSIVQSTLGVFIASAGTRRTSKALLSPFKVPLIYAILLARLLFHLDALPPEPLMKMITMLGQAAVPLGLLLLGMQLEKIISSFWRMIVSRGSAEPAQVETENCATCNGDESSGESRTSDEFAVRRDIAGGIISGFLRIAGGFLLAILFIRFFDFDPFLKKVLIVEASMPTAVNAVVYATEFNCRPRLVALGILTSTLLSALSLTLIIGYLN